jgi:pimeloyl-ACP methyl ester carboxylesterase
LAAPLAIAAAACVSMPPADVSRMHFVEAEGVQVHVETWGTGDPVLLIHGASSDMAVWEPTVVPLLKDRFRLTAYDRPGLGFTKARPARAETLAVQAKVAADVIAREGLERPVVVAHSYGGAVALRLALDRPDLISGLVLLSPAAYEWPGGVSWHLYWSGNPLVGPLFNNVIVPPFSGAALKAGVAGTFSPAPVPEGYFDAAGVARAVRPAAMRANADDMLAVKKELIAQSPRYPEIRLPVAVLAGDGDSVVSTPIHAERLGRELPNVRVEILPGVGHVPHEAAPEKVGEMIDWVRAASQK